jgi:hypothetical protein
MQVDAAQHLIVTEGLAQAADGQRQAAAKCVRREPKLARLFDLTGALDRFGVQGAKTKGLLHFLSSVFLESRVPGQRQPFQCA